MSYHDEIIGIAITIQYNNPDNLFNPFNINININSTDNPDNPFNPTDVFFKQLTDDELNFRDK